MSNCQNCNQPMDEGAKFCSNCGAKAPKSSQITVNQEAGTVSGTMTGAVLGELGTSVGIESTTNQKVDTISEGGTMVGTVLGGEGTTHIGGQQRYGETIEGDQHVCGDSVGGDKTTVGDISGATGIAIGRGAQATVSQDASATAVTAQQNFVLLTQEAAKGKQANDETVAGLIEAIADADAGLIDTIVNLFKNPPFTDAAGPVTNYMLKKASGS